MEAQIYEEDYIELTNGLVTFNSADDGSFSLSCPALESSTLPHLNIHQHFYLKIKERTLLTEQIPYSKSFTFYETYYDTKNFDSIRKDKTWIKGISYGDINTEMEYRTIRVKEHSLHYTRYLEEKINDIEQFPNVIPFVTFKVVREIRNWASYSIQCDTAQIERLNLSDSELMNNSFSNSFIKEWSYTVFTYCSDHISNEESGENYKPLARNKLFKYLDLFESDLYCDLQDIGIINEDESYRDYERVLSDYIDIPQYISDLKEHQEESDRSFSEFYLS